MLLTELINFLSIIFFLGEQPDESNLPKWVKVSKQKFDAIKKKVLNAKINNLQARPKGSKVININESNKLLHEIENSRITYEEALKRIKSIRSDSDKLVNAQSININQVNVLSILFTVNEISTGESMSVGVKEKGDFEIFKEKLDKEKQETDEQPDITDMPELESEESTAERKNQPGKGLKILTPDQMLSRIPITLAKLI